MPEQTWRNLPAGPELDALIAERVLGWRLDDCKEHGLIWATGNCGCVDILADCLPGFSTNPGAAWQVVEAMEARGNYYCLNLQRAHPGGPWRAYFAPYLRETEADTAPMAICLAALAALEAP